MQFDYDTLAPSTGTDIHCRWTPLDRCFCLTEQSKSKTNWVSLVETLMRPFFVYKVSGNIVPRQWHIIVVRLFVIVRRPCDLTGQPRNNKTRQNWSAYTGFDFFFFRLTDTLFSIQYKGVFFLTVWWNKHASQLIADSRSLVSVFYRLCFDSCLPSRM